MSSQSVNQIMESKSESDFEKKINKINIQSDFMRLANNNDNKNNIKFYGGHECACIISCNKDCSLYEAKIKKDISEELVHKLLYYNKVVASATSATLISTLRPTVGIVYPIDIIDYIIKLIPFVEKVITLLEMKDGFSQEKCIEMYKSYIIEIHTNMLQKENSINDEMKEKGMTKEMSLLYLTTLNKYKIIESYFREILCIINPIEYAYLKLSPLTRSNTEYISPINISMKNNFRFIGGNFIDLNTLASLAAVEFPELKNNFVSLIIKKFADNWEYQLIEPTIYDPSFNNYFVLSYPSGPCWCSIKQNRQLEHAYYDDDIAIADRNMVNAKVNKESKLFGTLKKLAKCICNVSCNCTLIDYHDSNCIHKLSCTYTGPNTDQHHIPGCGNRLTY